MSTGDKNVLVIPKEHEEFALAIGEGAAQDVSEGSQAIAKIPQDILYSTSEVIDSMIDQARKRPEVTKTEAERLEEDEQTLAWVAPKETELVKAAIRQANKTLAETSPYIASELVTQFEQGLTKLVSEAQQASEAVIKQSTPETTEDNRTEECEKTVQILGSLVPKFEEFEKSLGQASAEAKEDRKKRRSGFEIKLEKLDARRIKVSNERVKLTGPSPNEQAWHDKILDIRKLLAHENSSENSPYKQFEISAEEITYRIDDLHTKIDEDLKKTHETLKLAVNAKSTKDLELAQQDVKKYGEEKLNAQNLMNVQKNKANLQFNDNSVGFYTRKIAELKLIKKKSKEQEKELSNNEAMLKAAESWTEQQKIRDQAAKDLEKANETKRKITNQLSSDLQALVNQVYTDREECLKKLSALKLRIKSNSTRCQALQDQHLLQPNVVPLECKLTSEELEITRRYGDAIELIDELSEKVRLQTELFEKSEREWNDKAKQGLSELKQLTNPDGLKSLSELHEKIENLRKEITTSLSAKTLNGTSVTKALDELLPELKNLINQATTEIRTNSRAKLLQDLGESELAKNGKAVTELLDNLYLAVNPDATELISGLSGKQVVAVYDLFNKTGKEGLEKLNQLLKKGLGSPKVLKLVLEDGCQGDPQKLMDLHDAFSSDLGALDTLQKSLGSEAGKAIQQLRDVRFNKDSSKLKTEFFDKLNALDGQLNSAKKRTPPPPLSDLELRQKFEAGNLPHQDISMLIKSAVTFTGKSIPKAEDLPKPTNLAGKGISEADMEHFLKRHTRDYFCFNPNDADGLSSEATADDYWRKKNSMWPEGTTPALLSDYLENALNEVVLPDVSTLYVGDMINRNVEVTVRPALAGTLRVKAEGSVGSKKITPVSLVATTGVWPQGVNVYLHLALKQAERNKLLPDPEKLVGEVDVAVTLPALTCEVRVGVKCITQGEGKSYKLGQFFPIENSSIDTIEFMDIHAIKKAMGY